MPGTKGMRSLDRRKFGSSHLMWVLFKEAPVMVPKTSWDLSVSSLGLRALNPKPETIRFLGLGPQHGFEV